MNWHDHPDAAAIVRDHWTEAECFIVAQDEPCIDVRDDEIKAVDRYIHGGVPDDLRTWNRPRIWFIAVVVCPDDDLAPLTEFVRGNRLDPARVHFYLHPDTPYTALAPWRDAGFPLDRVDDAGKKGVPLSSWGALHGILGVHFNVQIVDDVLSR